MSRVRHEPGPLVGTATTRAAAALAASLLGAVAALQLAVAAGAPWGDHLYGGRVADPDGRLPRSYRAGSLSAAVLLPSLGLLLLARVGIVRAPLVPPQVLSRATWGVVVLLGINTIGNGLSTSTLERWGLGSLTALAAALSAVAARSPLPGHVDGGTGAAAAG